MNSGIVSTISDKCKRCYSCIRECPAKAIKVVNGQAAVMSERCIVCGHCVKVCSQNAKKIQSDIEIVMDQLIPEGNAFAIVAPSFAASFPEDYEKVPAALRRIGFSKVIETAFGADLISDLYYKEFQKNENKTLISSACPAVINYIEKYYGELVPNLAKIVSPMIAVGKYLKHLYGSDNPIVFIGPCVAKKQEAVSEEVAGVIDAVLTFTELKEIFTSRHINFDELDEVDFDPPHAYLGKSFPLAGGLLKTASIPGDILAEDIIAVEGKPKLLELVNEISSSHINAKFADVLFCEGCISGPAIDTDLNYYSRREKVIKYIEKKINTVDKQEWKSSIYNARDIDLTRTFSVRNQRKPYPGEEKIKEILAEINKYTARDELNCGACGYVSCREFAVAIAKGLAEKEMCLPLLIDQLAKAYNDLQSTQEQLRTAEKLASIGQLAAGVAHEINNPLGTIMIYASILKKELIEKVESGQPVDDLNLIIEEANRCKNIVANLLNFARQGKPNISRINIKNFLDGILRSVKVNPAYKEITVTCGMTGGSLFIEGDIDQLKQVYLNLINNACESMEDSQVKKLVITVNEDKDNVVTEIEDSGCGIKRENFGKIFTPFFTTKKMGKGTGLGLAITYGIVKMHRGHIEFQSEEGKGTKVTVKLQRKLLNENIENIEVN